MLELSLAPGEVLVVTAPRRLAATTPAAALSPQERARQAAYLLPADRERHAVAHWLKRTVLGRLLGVDPAALRFDALAGGKPVLAPVPGGAAPHFNLSHSGDWVALAVSGIGPVGVDIEQARQFDHAALAPQVMHPADRLDAPAGAAQGFFTAWSVKEAVTKCSGEGLALPFQTICLTPLPQRLYHCRHGARTWLAHHQCERGVHLAVASEQPWHSLRIQSL
jgi:phosphopantetheinyl transferase